MSGMRARYAPGSVRTTVAGRGRRKPSGPRAAEATDKALSAQQEPWRQRSDWVQHGSDRGDALTADAPARTIHVTPEPDEPEHRLDGFCWCQPTYEDVGLDGRLFVHRRFVDGRLKEEADA